MMLIPDELVNALLLRKEAAFAELTERRVEYLSNLEHHENTIDAARSSYCCDDITMDGKPSMSVSDNGVWVAAWLWVEIEEDDS